jgi:subfamily B ATP-binding cassette protein MsbA
MKDFSKILRYAKPYSKGIAFAFLCLIVTSVITLVLPLIVRNMINVVVVEKNAAALNSLTLDIIAVIAFQMVFGITQNYILGFVGNRMTADFRMDLFNHIQSLSLRFFQERRVGEIISRMSNDISVIQKALVSIPVAVLRQTVTLVGGLAIVFYLNWKLSGLILLVLPPLMLFARIFGKRLRNLAGQVQDQIARTKIGRAHV